jgi:hypothetical protein
MLQRSKNYVGEIGLFSVIVNYDQFHPQKYGEKKFVKNARQLSQQFNINDPSFIEAKISIDSLEDETSIVNFGQY